jgi:hypothetical protein
MTSPRRRLIAVASIVLLLIGSGFASSPSNAASHSGRLQIKGPGSVYSGPEAWAFRAVGAGTTAQFDLQVVNTGSQLAQYNIKATRQDPEGSMDLYTGSTSVTTLAFGPDGYYTAPIAPGRSQSFTLKVAVPAGTPQNSINTFIELRGTDGTQIDWSEAVTEIKAPTYGTTAADVFAKQGSQAYIGGSLDDQATSSPAISVGGSAAFTVKLQNDGFDPGVVAVQAYTGFDCDSIVVKDGTADVTAAVLNGTYVTPTLAVHAARTLSVTMKRTGAAGCGSYDVVTFFAHDAGNTVQHNATLVTPFPAG